MPAGMSTFVRVCAKRAWYKVLPQQLAVWRGHYECRSRGDFAYAVVAQLEEQLICIQMVAGSTPVSSSPLVCPSGVSAER